MATISNNANFEPPDPPAKPTETKGISDLVIAEGAPFHLKLKNLKCSEVRWFFENRTGELVAFNGNDSLILEIMYRFGNGQNLDPEARSIYDKYLKKFYFRKLESSGISNDLESKPPLVLNHLYKASKDLKSISPVFWEGKPISIERGAYLTLTDEIIEQELAMKLQRKQEEVLVGHYPHEENFEIETKSGSIEKVHVVWYSPTQLTIHREGHDTRTIIRHYRDAATWNKEHSKVDHLVFVVHGVLNNGKVQNIVKGAKGLNKGINSRTEKGCGIIFMPIHWRTNLYGDKKSHKCAKVTGRKSARLQNRIDDLKLYNCKECGPKVKEKVISEFNRIYTQFLSYYPDFNGCISLFGHSLGSVICYDILTEKSMSEKLEFKNPIDKLFTVGSPLWFFFEIRGKADMTKFQRTVESLPIYNIYHPNDPVAGRLEEVVDRFYKDTPPIGIKSKNVKYRIVARPATRLIYRVIRRTRVLLRKVIMLQGVTKLKFPIDYELEIKIGVESLEIPRNNDDNEENQPTTPASNNEPTTSVISENENSGNPKSQESSQDAATQTEISYPIRINRTQSA